VFVDGKELAFLVSHLPYLFVLDLDDVLKSHDVGLEEENLYVE
jgi:hypothetical protein